MIAASYVPKVDAELSPIAIPLFDAYSRDSIGEVPPGKDVRASVWIILLARWA